MNPQRTKLLEAALRDIAYGDYADSQSRRIAQDALADVKTYEPRHRTTEGEHRAAIRRSLEEAGGRMRRCNLPVTGALEPKCALPIGHDGPHTPQGAN